MAVAAGTWQVMEISCTPAELLMLKRALRPFDTHCSYKAKKSAVAAVEAVAVVDGGGGLGGVPF